VGGQDRASRVVASVDGSGGVARGSTNRRIGVALSRYTRLTVTACARSRAYAGRAMPARDSLERYRRKRDFERTPEPAPGPIASSAAEGRFVIQEHHATALHWDFRLEKDGVLVSWAVPKGLPATPKQNHLAIHTEDHPMEYLTFAGDIPASEYGGGKVILWDTGTFEAEKFRDSEVMVTLHS